MSGATGMYCRGCCYDLRGVTVGAGGAGGARCPECGRGFDAGEPGTYLRGLRWRKARKWVFLAAALVVVYAVVPRGYVKGVSVLSPGAGAPGMRITQWGLAPPRWLSRVPYPRWTVVEGAPHPPKGSQYCDTRLERTRWLEPSQVVASISIQDPALTEARVRKSLTTLVRHQCEGYTGVFLADEDGRRMSFEDTEPW